MGKVAKVAIPVAAVVGLGIATGGFGFAAAGAAGGGAVGGYSAATLAAAGGGGSLSLAAVGGSSAGFFSSLTTVESLLLGSSLLTGGMQVLGGFAAADEASFLKAQFEQQRRLAALRGDQEVNQINEARRRAIAGAVNNLPDGGSQRAFLSELNRAANEDVETSKLNTASGITTSNLQIAQASRQGAAGMIGGFGGAAGTALTTTRSLLKSRSA